MRIRIYARAKWSLDAQAEEVHTMNRGRPSGYLPDARERVVDTLRTAGLRASGMEDTEGGVVIYTLASEWQAHSQQVKKAIRDVFPRR